ncbi:hypothetical protein, partial [Propionibacterium freudenreichii]|uniref:hypothetical protein n=1 Tax=Propionibacterium freudenreichii TaxID=1744 RepID=UPI0038546309
NDIGIDLIRLVGGEHVVIGGNNGDIVTQHAFQGGFIIGLAGREAVRRWNRRCPPRASNVPAWG